MGVLSPVRRVRSVLQGRATKASEVARDVTPRAGAPPGWPLAWGPERSWALAGAGRPAAPTPAQFPGCSLGRAAVLTTASPAAPGPGGHRGSPKRPPVTVTAREQSLCHFSLGSEIWRLSPAQNPPCSHPTSATTSSSGRDRASAIGNCLIVALPFSVLVFPHDDDVYM